MGKLLGQLLCVMIGALLLQKKKKLFPVISNLVCMLFRADLDSCAPRHLQHLSRLFISFWLEGIHNDILQ